MVYTGRFTDYLLGAVTVFFGDLAGGTYWRWLETLGVDTPCKGMESAFQR